MKDTSIDTLRIENQLCFPLYTASREVIRQYDPFLKKLDLTYTQYLVMLVLWEEKEMNLKDLGNILYLDSGTLTPLLKKMEVKGYLLRQKDEGDARNLIVTLTEKGCRLKEQAKEIPEQIADCLKLQPEEAKTLYHLLYQIIHQLETES